MEYIYVGKIVNTHGIKGEVRILSDFKFKDRALEVGKKVYIGKNKDEEVIDSFRLHKNFLMVRFEDINHINDVLKYKGMNVFTTRDELGLRDDEYLDSDVIGFSVLVNGEVVGTVSRFLKDRYQDKIVVNIEGKEYLVPFVCGIINDVDLKKGCISVKNVDGLLG